jgi:plastocyanin
MRCLCTSFLSFLCLLVGLLFSRCTSGDKKGNVPVSGASQAETKPADTSVATSNIRQSGHIDTIEIKGMKFKPEELTIHKGDTVVWVNNDLTGHCVTEAAKKWTSSSIPSGASWKKAINENTDYYCAIHVVMKGKINVE